MKFPKYYNEVKLTLIILKLLKYFFDIIVHLSVSAFGLGMLYYSIKDHGLLSLPTIFMLICGIGFVIYSIIHFYELVTGKIIFNK